MGIKTRNYADTYLYSKGGYEDAIVKFLMSSDRVDKNHKSFETIKYEVKRRQIHKCLLDVLENDNLVLVYGSMPLPRSFKVFTCKDIKRGDGKSKTFIDVTNIIYYENGAYNIKTRGTEVDIFISYLMAAMTEMIYYTDANKLLNNNGILTDSTECFAKLVFYIIDYLRIGNVEKIREKTMYLSAKYYNQCLLDKDGDTVENRARKLSGLNQREADILDLYVNPDSFKNIDTFIKTLSKSLKDTKLDTSVFIDKWRYLYGPSTLYATELYTVFSKMLTDTYVAAYINNQRTIEKICGNTFIEYTKTLLRIGSEVF